MSSTTVEMWPQHSSYVNHWEEHSYMVHMPHDLKMLIFDTVRPILNEWVERGDVALDHLIAHVLVHEIAHHFGYSDEQIAEIDDWRL